MRHRLTAEKDPSYLAALVADRNGDVFELVTEVGEDVLTSEKYEISVFARELDTLLQAGYVRVGDFLVPPTP